MNMCCLVLWVQINTPQQGLGGLQAYASGSMSAGRQGMLHITTPQVEDDHSLSIGGTRSFIHIFTRHRPLAGIRQA